MPGIFVGRMEKVTASVVATGASELKVYFDNFDVATADMGRPEIKVVEDHLGFLDELLSVLDKAGVKLSLGKTTLLASTLPTMGVVIENGGWTLAPERLEAWNALLAPRPNPTLKDLQKIVGVLNYAMPHGGLEYARVIEPLYSLLKKRVAAEREAGDDRPALLEVRCLRKDWGEILPTVATLLDLVRKGTGLETLDMTSDVTTYIQGDASDKGAGVVVFQHDAAGRRRIALMLRRSFTTQQQSWSIGGRELYALLLAARRWHRLLARLRGPLVIIGDHLNLLSMEFLEQAHVQRWVAELMTWLPMISSRVHIGGEANVLADVLSRQPQQPTLTLAEEPRAEGAGGAQAAAARAVRFVNPHESELTGLGKIIVEAQQQLTAEARKAMLEEPGVHEIVIDNKRVLMRKGAVVAPDDAALLAQLFKVLHDDFRHAGVDIALELMSRGRFYVKGAAARLREYIDSCPACQLVAAGDHEDTARARMLAAPRYPPWQRVQLDHFTLPTDDNGFSGFFIVVDPATRLALLHVVKDTSAAGATAALELWARVYPTPGIVSVDGGPSFKGAFVAACDKLDIKLDVGTPYNHQGRGTVERLGGVVKAALKRMLPPGSKLDWRVALPTLASLVNTTPHAGLGGLTPHDVAFVMPAAPRPAALLGVRVTPKSWAEVMDATVALRKLTELCSEVATLGAKARHDMVVREHKYEKGDWALLWYPDRQTSLDAFYRGPYEIVKHEGGDFYQLREVLAGDALATTATTAHAARIVPFIRDRTSAAVEHQRKLPEGYHVIEDIVDGPREGDGRFLVKWAFLASPTWEPFEALRGGVRFKEYCAANDLLHTTGLPPLARTRGGKAVRMAVRE